MSNDEIVQVIESLAEMLQEEGISKAEIKSDDVKVKIRCGERAVGWDSEDFYEESIENESDASLMAPSPVVSSTQSEIPQEHLPSESAQKLLQDVDLQEEEPEQLEAIRSLAVGRFVAKGKGVSPFAIGDQIAKDQLVGYVETIGMLQELKSPISGVVVEILVEAGEPVEYNQGIVVVRR